MEGTALIFYPGSPNPEVHELKEPPALEFLQKSVGGGFIEAVPGFHTIYWDSRQRRCVVFCNEGGKLYRLPVNTDATRLWYKALVSTERATLSYGDKLLDVLVGPVVVLYGDDEFMAEL